MVPKGKNRTMRLARRYVETTLYSFFISFLTLFFNSADAIKEWFVKQCKATQWARDRVFYTFRWVKRARDQEEFEERYKTLTDPVQLQQATGIQDSGFAEQIASYFQTNWFGKWKGMPHTDLLC
jgi:hypothetical protein